MKRKVYIETSIISYLTARPSKTIIGAAHQQITQAWWDTRNDYDLFVSGSVLAECAAGNTDAAEKRLNAVNGVPLLSSTDSAIDLARHLILKSIIPLKAAEDALHIALATIDFIGNLAQDVDLQRTHGRFPIKPNTRHGLFAHLELSAYRQYGNTEKHIAPS